MANIKILYGSDKLREAYPKINENFGDVNREVNDIRNRVNNIITTPIDGEAAAQELIDARGEHSTLGERLDEFDSHMAEDVSQEGGVHGLKMESGVWTPILSAETTAPTVTVVSARGTYDRVGNIAKCSFFMRFTATGGSGHAIIKGFPFVFKALDEIGVATVTTKSTIDSIYGVKDADYVKVRATGVYVNISELNTGVQFDVFGSIIYRVL